jgi:hypothetical protein
MIKSPNYTPKDLRTWAFISYLVYSCSLIFIEKKYFYSFSDWVLCQTVSWGRGYLGLLSNTKNTHLLRSSKKQIVQWFQRRIIFNFHKCMRITDNLQVKYKHVFYCGYVTVENKRSDKIN